MHRQGIYPALKKWFDMPIPEKEYQERHKADELLCLTPEVLKEVKPRPLYEVAGEIGDERAAAARKKLAELKPEERRKRLREEWAKLLGDVEPRESERYCEDRRGRRVGTATAGPLLLEVGARSSSRRPADADRRPRHRCPLVVCVCQQGKQAFLKERADAVAALLEGGAAVCLPDLRGTGETQPGDGRGRQSAATSISSTELMLGPDAARLAAARPARGPEVPARLARTSGTSRTARIALWGDSLAPVNPPTAI